MSSACSTIGQPLTDRLLLGWRLQEAAPELRAAAESLQNSLLGLIFSELKKYLAELGGGGDPNLPDDTVIELLVLLYRQKRSAAVQRYFAAPGGLDQVLTLVRRATPRVQRLSMRLCRFVRPLPFVLLLVVVVPSLMPS